MSIKRMNPNATFDVVTVYDEAIQHETAEELEVLKASKERSRFEKYLETFDINELKFVEGQKPTLVRVRCLRAQERAEMDQKYQTIDVVKKTIEYKNRHEMMLELFEKAVLGIVNEDGSLEKIGVEDVEYKVATDLGATVSMLGSLSKNLKKA